MVFKNLEDKCLYYRSLSNYKLLPNSYVLVMLDGRSFSNLIKNKFEKPFDKDFIDMMNQTAQYVCENVEGAKLAYVQSDEISLVITDFDTPTTDAFFGYRFNKLTSIIASLATGKFNQLMLQYNLSKYNNKQNVDDVVKFIEKQNLCQFDCKVWNVPTLNDVFAWFLYRQIDCVRNSKQQAAQTFISHKNLMNLNVDAQIKLLFEQKGIDWNEYSMDEKYGRFIWKQKVIMNNIDTGDIYKRHKWLVQSAFPLMDETGREKFFQLNVIPNNN